MANIKRANTSGITKSGVAIADVPDAPTIGSATAGQESATVTYTAATTGGTGTTFTATSTPGSITGTGSSPITISGLTASTSYTFAVTASNSTGTSPSSSSSNSVTVLATPSDFESIQTFTMTNNTTTVVDFTSIPNTYKALQLRVIFAATIDAAEGWISINGDTTAGNYSRQVMYNTGTGTGVSFTQTSQASGRAYFYAPDSITNYPNTYMAHIINFPDYALTNKNKTSSADYWQGMGGTVGSIVQQQSLWASTAAINRLTFTMQSGNYASGTQFALYGVK